MSKGVVNKNPPKWLDDIAEYMEEKGFHGNIITIRDGMFFLRNNWLDFKERCDSIYEEKKKQKKPKNTSNKEKKTKKRKRNDDENDMIQEENMEENMEENNGGNSVEKKSNSTQNEQKNSSKKGKNIKSTKGKNKNKSGNASIEVHHDIELVKHLELCNNILEEYSSNQEDVISLTKDQLLIIKNTLVQILNQFKQPNEFMNNNNDDESEFNQLSDNECPQTPEHYYYD